MDGFASLLAPGSCSLCNAPLVRAARHPICDLCLTAAAEQEGALLCTRCGESLGLESTRAADLAQFPVDLCPVCEETPPPFVRANSFGTYGGPLREMIHLLKYAGVQSLARPLGSMLAAAILDAVSDGLTEGSAPLTVVAVPLFRRKRPFNQSTLLAAEAVRVLRRSRPELKLRERHAVLRRTRPTESQISLRPSARRKNVSGAFAAVGDVRGLAILLVDDVYTTGATAWECTRVLLLAGAASVRVVTLARAQRETAVRWQPSRPSIFPSMPLFDERQAERP